MEEKKNLRVNVILIEHKESFCGGKNRFLVTPHLQIIAQSSDTRFFFTSSFEYVHRQQKEVTEKVACVA